VVSEEHKHEEEHKPTLIERIEDFIHHPIESLTGHKSNEDEEDVKVDGPEEEREPTPPAYVDSSMMIS
jgi:hypothetical protein